MKKRFWLLGIVIVCLLSTGVLAETCSSTNTIKHNEPKKLKFGEKEYAIYISKINAQEVRLVVGDESTNRRLKEGESYNLIDGNILTVKEILYQDYAGGTKSVKFCINGKAGTELKLKPDITPTTMKADLANYPAMFMKDKVLNAYFVVGLGATIDSLIMADVWLTLEKEGFSYVLGEATKADIEVSDPLNTNLIVIGKASENKIADFLMKKVSGSLNKGEGMLKLFENKGYVQLLVTGYSDDGVRKAAKVLENYKKYNLKGKEMIVTGTLSNLLVKESKTPLKIIKKIGEVEKPKEELKTTPQIQVAKETTCNGCKENSNCLPYGTRLIKDSKAKYCSVSKNFKEQGKLGSVCQNNYECLSNQCSNAKCIDLSGEIKEAKSFLEKIFDWLKSIFG
tara:strand:+ start:1989 stop:3176 length:1188 start_codon:yes stop_codon:yes gene_type:complete